MINWKEFESKQGERLQKAFEDLTYHLFCYEFNDGKGIHRYHNQKGLETNPIKHDENCIGFQTKVYDVPLYRRKTELIRCIDDAKEIYPKLTKLVFYIYRECGQSSKKNQNKSDYIQDIEDYGSEKGIEIVWRGKSEIEHMFLEHENILLYYIFFKDDFNGIETLEYFIEKSENKTRPDLKNKYYKIKEIHDKLVKTIRNNRIVAITGNQTIGKTRLSIEVAKELCEKEEINVIIIKFPDTNLITNLKHIIKRNKKYLLIFDNYINNYLNLYHIVDEFWNLGENINNIKFIFTLKNPYTSSLNEELNDFGIAEFPLDTISDEEMRKIINEYKIEHGLKLTPATTNKILDRSKGNWSLHNVYAIN